METLKWRGILPGDGFNHVFFFTPTWGKIPILTNISQMSWNYQLD